MRGSSHVNYKMNMSPKGNFWIHFKTYRILMINMLIVWTDWINVFAANMHMTAAEKQRVKTSAHVSKNMIWGEIDQFCVINI